MAYVIVIAVLAVVAVVTGVQAELGPNGNIIALELSWSPGRAQALLGAGQVSDDVVRQALAWDYVFIVAYATGLASIAIALAARVLARAAMLGASALAALTAGFAMWFETQEDA